MKSRRKTDIATQPVAKAGYRPEQWAQAAGMSRGLLYKLEGDVAPRSVKVGGARIILESPGEYLARIAARQSEQQAA